MNTADYKERYNILFPDEKSKADAFDKIAENYYFANFATMQKAELDLLLFSIYLERVLAENKDKPSAYSDYTLSKQLGITQNRVSSLKERKELKYPDPKFDWRQSFEKICDNARYEDGKIKIYIPDRTLYLELKNIVEENGGFVDVQLNSKLLQLKPEFFIDLMLEISEEEDRKKIRNQLKQEMAKKNIDTMALESAPFSDLLKDVGVNVISDLIGSCIPFVSPLIANIIRSFINKFNK